MAQHVIYDSQGRIEKILNDKEYNEQHGCSGCLYSLGTLLFIAFIIGSIIGGVKNKSNEPTNKKEYLQNSSQNISTVEESTNYSNDIENSEYNYIEEEEDIELDENPDEETLNDLESSNNNENNIIEDPQNNSIEKDYLE